MSTSVFVRSPVTCDQDLQPPTTTTETAPSSTGKSCNSKARERKARDLFDGTPVEKDLVWLIGSCQVYDSEVQMPTPNHPASAELCRQALPRALPAEQLQHEDETSWTALPALSGLFHIRVERFKLAGQHPANTPPQYTAPRNPVDLLARGSTCGSPLNAIGLQSQWNSCSMHFFLTLPALYWQPYRLSHPPPSHPLHGESLTCRSPPRPSSLATTISAIPSAPEPSFAWRIPDLQVAISTFESGYQCSEKARSPPSLRLAVSEPARASQDMHVVVVNYTFLYLQHITTTTTTTTASNSTAHRMAAPNVAYARPRLTWAEQIRAEILAGLDPVPAYTPGLYAQLPAAYDRLPTYDEIANDIVVERGPPVNESSAHTPGPYPRLPEYDEIVNDVVVERGPAVNELSAHTSLGAKVVRVIKFIKEWVGLHLC
ncbi:hypothetical protein C8F04DRAFT_1173057 [Mycena alexandri]|uniref:Uncharacterized protein n=1 Tax=Mycena alexandri TaxID=1745969 RepID=A0AAD6THB4_9AGAR|nr:hypothetical protein C8F04DRAFT_1173057 [Mycena alexandri]